MLYLIGYTVGIFVCMLYLMIFANDAVKKRDGKWVWNYDGIITCSVMWPISFTFVMMELLDKLLMRALSINIRYRENLKKELEKDQQESNE